MSVAEAPARTLPRPYVGQKVLFNTGNSPYWHPAEVTMVSQYGSDVELAVLMVYGRDQRDQGGTHCVQMMKSPCWHYQDERINDGNLLWKTIVEDQSGGMWKFREEDEGFYKDIAELRESFELIHKRLDKLDEFMHDLGHTDTLGDEPGETKNRKRKRKTPSGNDEDETASED